MRSWAELAVAVPLCGVTALHAKLTSYEVRQAVSRQQQTLGTMSAS